MMESNEHAPKKGPRKQEKKKRKVPLTRKQEGLAQSLAAGEHFLVAFKKNYNVTGMNENNTYKKAHFFSNQKKVQDRVAELRAKMKLMEAAHLSGAAPLDLPKVIEDSFTKEKKIVSDVIVNRQTLTHMLLQDRALARELGQAAAAIAALKELGKVHQITTDNREVNKISEVEQMNPQQLREFIQVEIQKCGMLIEIDDGLLELVDMRPLTDTKQ